MTRRLSYRLKLFAALSLVAIVAAGLVAILTAGRIASATTARLERTLVSETRLAAELLSHAGESLSPQELDAEADRLGQFVDARVTFVSADGRVIGDSAEDGAALSALERHDARPEIRAAMTAGLGTARRYSTTVNTDMLYVAAATRHPAIAVVRFALPLTEIRTQVALVRQGLLLGLGAALAVALALAWIGSSLLARRLERLASAARTHAAGARPIPADEGDDEIGQLGRTLNESLQALTNRMADLDRARGRLEAILTGMVEGVMVVDREGRVQLVNDSARQLLGVAMTAAAGTDDVQRYLHVIRHPVVVAQFDAALAGSRPADAELVLPGGRVAIARAVPLADGGAVLVLHDITSLRAADRVRRDFIANASHELRTPLTVIRGYAEALRDDGLGTAERQRFLEVIDRHAGRMTQLVQDLLRLARLDSGQEPAVTQAEVDVNALFRRLVEDLRARLEAKGQQLITSVAADAATVVSDPAKLEEILRNIVENAVNYSPAGTAIHLAASRRERALEFSVEDEGPGIPPEDLDRIFERFYRVDKARGRESGGTGLGLSIARHLAERIRGRIDASNRAGGGAAFRLTVPAAATSI